MEEKPARVFSEKDLDALLAEYREAGFRAAKAKLDFELAERVYRDAVKSQSRTEKALYLWLQDRMEASSARSDVAATPPS